MSRLLTVTLIALLVTLAFNLVPMVHAYTFNVNDGTITSTDGRITVRIPYIALPSPPNATGLIGPIAPTCGDKTGISCPDFITQPFKWFEAIIVNFLIDVANSLIYIVNLILGFIVKFIGGILDIPIYLFNAISITTLGPIVDFLSFIPAGYAWLADTVVWAVAVVEWILIIIVIAKVAQVVIGSLEGVLGEGEGSLKTDAGELA